MLSVVTMVFLLQDDGEPKEQPSQPRERRKTVVVTATRSETDPFETGRALTVIGTERITERNPISLVDALNDQPGIWVEKRTSTTSDPVVRGMAGSHLLALIDGNSLSTLWGEGGCGADDPSRRGLDRPHSSRPGTCVRPLRFERDRGRPQLHHAGTRGGLSEARRRLVLTKQNSIRERRGGVAPARGDQRRHPRRAVPPRGILGT